MKIRSLVSKFLPLIGFVGLAVVILFQLWFENSGRELLFNEQVVKLNVEVSRGDIIEESMLFYANVGKDSVIQGAITDPRDIIGKAVKQYIPINAQLNDAYFEIPELIMDENHLTMKIPNEWLYSIPNTLRARDRIYLKEVTAEVLYADQVAGKGPEVDSDVTNFDDDEMEGLSTYEEFETSSLASKAGEIILEATVAYVKDSANREVVTLSRQDRVDGSSVIRDVEIVLTLEEAKKLEETRSKGSKFIIMYKEG